MMKKQIKPRVKKPATFDVTVQMFHQDHGLVFEMTEQKTVTDELFSLIDEAAWQVVDKINNKRECVIKVITPYRTWYYQYGRLGNLVKKYLDEAIPFVHMSPPLRNLHLYTNTFTTKGKTQRQHQDYTVNQVFYWSQSYVYLVSINPNARRKKYQIDYYRIHGSEHVKPGKHTKTYHFNDMLDLKRHMVQEFY